MVETFIVEAESMSLDTYRIEANGSASGGELISLAGGWIFQTGTASFSFEGASGEYDIVVGYYDENDGISRLEVKQNDNVLDSWRLNRNFPSGGANSTTATTREIAAGITVNQGDNFTLTGRERWFEPARVDYLEFIPVNSEPSILALGNSIFTVNEAAGTVDIPVVRTGNLQQTVSVNYQTFAETAIAGEDFTATEGTLTFAPGESSQNITVPIIDDETVDPEETFSLTIDSVTGNGTLDAPRTARITINDNETPVDAVILEETESNTQVSEAGGSDSYSITLGSQPNSNVTVDITTDDQVSTDVATLTFTPDNWNEAQTVSVSAIDDDLQEGNHQGTISHSVSSEDNTFDGFTLEDLAVDILDNDLGAFVLETFASGLNQPTAIDWTPNGESLFVAQQIGIVRLIENGSLAATPFIDISEQVNNTRDRGLLGLAVHPDFPNQPYVYLAFTYDPPEAQGNTGLAGPDGNGNRPSRVIRIEADPSTDFTTALPNSEVVIAGANSTWENISRPDANSTNDFDIPPSGITPEGENIQDYLATDSESHSVGALRFGTDGSLFISNGDGTSYNQVDPRSVRVQDIDNLSGKILRVDPLTGDGLSDNPFYDGNPDSNRSKVYSYGLRNPFRFTIDPDTNEPYIGDVGWKTWEEINTGAGANFGWPYYEGGNEESLQQNEYQTLPEAQAFYESGESVTTPLYARNHSDGAVAIIMGDFYTGDTFPDVYDDALFFSDFGDSTVRYLTFENGNVEVNTFQDNVGGLTQISTGPDGNLYGVNRGTGEIISWSFDPTQSGNIIDAGEQNLTIARTAQNDFLLAQSF
ncbi:PQQ-dependent sugar dehydrogenase [Myxosarcina sp. GI1]|uniref:PQQ-dependent sugar dehydrogenase n=1 Tax=Myxosarcina sp. GI1 TaxID=1541065 RepID=UPI0006925E89|nr:PQQ-dependent sugar dehydrogenase [Myxosarcina sp. GI1]